MKEKGFRLKIEYPGCKWKIGDIITEKNDKKLFKDFDKGLYTDCFEEVDGDSIYYFINGWKPLHELVYQEIQGRKLWIWCEYLAGGEARELYVDTADYSPYIFCDVQFVNSLDKNQRLAQGAVCYSFDKNIKSPYTSEEQRSIWREIIKMTDVRTIKYKR